MRGALILGLLAAVSAAPVCNITATGAAPGTLHTFGSIAAPAAGALAPAVESAASDALSFALGAVPGVPGHRGAAVFFGVCSPVRPGSAGDCVSDLSPPPSLSSASPAAEDVGAPAASAGRGHGGWVHTPTDALDTAQFLKPQAADLSASWPSWSASALVVLDAGTVAKPTHRATATPAAGQATFALGEALQAFSAAVDGGLGFCFRVVAMATAVPVSVLRRAPVYGVRPYLDSADYNEPLGATSPTATQVPFVGCVAPANGSAVTAPQADWSRVIWTAAAGAPAPEAMLVYTYSAMGNVQFSGRVDFANTVLASLTADIFAVDTIADLVVEGPIGPIPGVSPAPSPAASHSPTPSAVPGGGGGSGSKCHGSGGDGTTSWKEKFFMPTAITAGVALLAAMYLAYAQFARPSGTRAVELAPGTVEARKRTERGRKGMSTPGDMEAGLLVNAWVFFFFFFFFFF
jgi:hypothetical protein